MFTDVSRERILTFVVIVLIFHAIICILNDTSSDLYVLAPNSTNYVLSESNITVKDIIAVGQTLTIEDDYSSGTAAEINVGNQFVTNFTTPTDCTVDNITVQLYFDIGGVRGKSGVAAI